MSEADDLFDFGPEATPEEKNKAMEAWIREIQEQRAVPKWLLFKQFMALVYVGLCFVFLYVSIGSPIMGYASAALFPLVVLIMDYFMMIREKKMIAIGKKRGEQVE